MRLDEILEPFDDGSQALRSLLPVRIHRGSTEAGPESTFSARQREIENTGQENTGQSGPSVRLLADV